MDKIVLIDGNSLANRAYYALPFLTDPSGRTTGAVFGFVNILVKIITEDHPKGIIVAFDHARKTFRNEMYDQYKATRHETPPELKSQFPLIKDILSKMGITVLEQSNVEGDDLIGSAAKQLEGKKVILSGDRDLLQLIDDDTEVWLTMKGVSVVNKFGLRELKAIYNISPKGVIDLKALMGDVSDNIPGVSGIGEKTALKLLEEYSSLDGIYQNISKISGKLREKLESGKQMAYLSKQLATIVTNAPLPTPLSSSYIFPFSQSVKDLFKSFGFGSLLKRPEIFGGDVIVEEKQKFVIDSNEKLQNALSEIKNEFAYNLDSMQFSTRSGIIYSISQTFDMFSSVFTIEQVIETLKPVFENPNIQKICLDAKQDMHFLKKYSISLNNFFDLKLATHLIHAGQSEQKITNSVDEFFALKSSLCLSLNDLQLDKLYSDLELPLCKVLFEMEESGFKIDTNELEKIDVDISTRLESLTQNITDLAGEPFNLNSPKQMAHILFEKLDLHAYGNKKNSTGIDVLNELRFAHPIVEQIIEYRKLQKLKSTYIDVYKRLCDEKGNIIHTNFNQSLTSTGRLSSSAPNLQNIPTNDDEGKILRKIFISKFDGGKILSADYSQIELRLLADMSGEEKLIEIYNNGEDIHTQTACQIFGVSPSEVTPKMRREAKAVNFGVIYGISDYGLSQNIKISRKSAKSYIDSYFSRYPKVKQFSDDNVSFAKKNGFIRTKYGRIRHIPEINASSHSVRSFGERVAMNMPLQGTASDIIKKSMLNVSNALKKEKLKSELILQIHDELVLDVFPGEEERVKKLVHNEMENWLNLKVPLPANINCGKNLLECK